jgi:Ca-activated chloride channel homolog
MRTRDRVLLTAALLCVIYAVCAVAFSQAGRHPVPSAARTTLLNVTAIREDGSDTPVSAKEVALYDDSVEQKVQSFSPDPTPARIVLLVDNSKSLRTDVPKLAQVAREFIYEIFEGDQLLIVGYDEQAEIVTDWTDNPKQVEASLNMLRKQGEPHLFDAITAVIDEAFRPLSGGTRKRAIVLIGDGLDRGSKTKFRQALAELQTEDIAVYALQIPDRTGGALRRDQPKPAQVVEQLAEATGGRVLPLSEPRTAANAICNELRSHRYLLAYSPSTFSAYDARRLLVTGPPGIDFHYKAAQPPK